MSKKEGEIYFNAFMKALGEVKKHNTPSPETAEFISDTKVVLGKLNAHFENDGIVPRIENHVKETNGKVAANTKWRNTLAGGMAVIIVLLPILTAIFAYFLNDMKSDMANMITIEIQKNNNKFFELD